MSRGVVATSERHAAEAGARILRNGGNAIDAAIATAATLTVTEPTSNGLGGDLFAVVLDQDRLFGLDASGRAPRRLTLHAFEGMQAVPTEGWLGVTVPGQVGGWWALHQRFGSLAWKGLFRSAIDLAREGFPVGEVTAAAWARAAARFETFEEWNRVFAPGGKTPAAGESFTNPDLADSLELVSERGRPGFYEELATRICAHAHETDGLLTLDDFRAAEPEWVSPIEARFGDYRVFEIGAPTQGIVALESLAILEALERPDDPHFAIEAIKRSFHDAYATVADGADVVHLASPHRAHQTAARIGERAWDWAAAPAPAGGTVLLCVATARQMVAVIQSNFHGFGSGIVVPGTGIALHNRGVGFSLDPEHPNCVAPGRKPFHTILPAYLQRSDGICGVFGVMGGQMQPQGHVQMIRRLHAGADPAEAVAHPRWRWMDDGRVLLERGTDEALGGSLRDRGHDVVTDVDATQFGGAQMILRGPDGFVAGSDPRKDGCVSWGSVDGYDVVL